MRGMETIVIRGTIVGGIKLSTGGDCFLNWNQDCRLVVVIYFIC